LPGDYTAAVANITGLSTAACNGGVGNGNGRIETGGGNEDILAWEHISKAGFINGTYTCAGTVAASTNPTNPYAIPLQLVYDGAYGSAGTGALRHNLKMGNQIPVEIIAEVDRKVDDGFPNTGGFQFSAYTITGGTAPTEGTTLSPSCTSAAGNAATWNATNGSTNCGGASLF